VEANVTALHLVGALIASVGTGLVLYLVASLDEARPLPKVTLRLKVARTQRTLPTMSARKAA
jgi:hypothetical protein